MMSEEATEKLVERITKRIEDTNTKILKRIASNIRQFKNITPTQAHQLAQTLIYGGDYEAIAKELAEMTKLNVKEIYKIFMEVAKQDYEFSEQFYKYRKKKFIPFDENTALKNQVEAMAKMTAKTYANLSKTTAFMMRINGKKINTKLAKAYQKIIDEAVVSVAQGKETFDSRMRKIIKDLGKEGIRTVDYADGSSRRLDSAVRQNMKEALRNLHNETQRIVGEQFGADGVEISVHEHPAPDHADVQGHQFTNEEFEKFQSDQMSESYDGKKYPPEHLGRDRRSISQYNCYHYTFAVVLGVNAPLYSQEQLDAINKANNKGFDFEGKHYTLYQGTQMQRQIETAIRYAKDTQIMAREMEDDALIEIVQDQITKLTGKYNKLSRESGLPTKAKRMQVSGYRRVAVKHENKPVEF